VNAIRLRTFKYYPDNNFCTAFVNVVDVSLVPSTLKCFDSGHDMCDFLSCIDGGMYYLPLSFVNDTHFCIYFLSYWVFRQTQSI